MTAGNYLQTSHLHIRASVTNQNIVVRPICQTAVMPCDWKSGVKFHRVDQLAVLLSSALVLALELSRGQILSP